MRLSSLVVVALAVVFVAAAAARADGNAASPGSADDPAALEQARHAFEEGIALASQERWFDAAAAFRRSRAHMERPSTLFNLASVLFRLGAYVEADQILHDYFKIAAPDDKQRAEAERLQGLVRESLVQLELAVEPSDAQVRIDAKDAPGAGPARTLTLDPGAHVVTISREGYHARRERLEAQAGQVLRLDVKLEAVKVEAVPLVPVAAPTAALTPDSAREPREPRDNPGFFEQPIVWILGGVLLAGAAVTTAVLIANNDDEPAEPFRGTSNMVLVVGP
jgi:tetratricopeptide (TPR) repeat protein